MRETGPDRPSDGRTMAPWRTALLAGAAGLFAVAQVDSASAQLFGQSNGAAKAKSPRTATVNPKAVNPKAVNPKAGNSKTVNSKKDAPIRHPFGEDMPKGPLQLMVSIGEQRAVLYSNGVRVAETKVSTGTPSHPTPTGVFSIIQKNRWHRSNLYGNAPMFFMHRLTWSGIALHEGHLPGFAASHGCIRMPTDFVSRLWNVSRLGMRVVVARVELAPQEFSHAKLFQPAQKPVDNVSRTSELPDALRPSLVTVGQGWVRVAQMSPVNDDFRRLSDAPSLGAGIQADSARERSGVPVGAEMSAAPPASPAAPAATLTEALPSAAPAADVAATPVAPAAESEPATTATIAVPAPPTVAAESARSTQADAGSTAPVPAAANNEPERPAIDPQELQLPRPAPLRTRAAEPVKLNGQVAVFISGKEKRIYVRQAFVPLFDMPVEIANPSKSLGTHTFTALEAVDNGTRMRWNLVSMPLTAGQQTAASANKKGAPPPKASKAVRGAVVTSESSNASDALDRVTIPPEAVERIADLLTPGSSLIISDEGLGRETGRYTEFIVETR